MRAEQVKKEPAQLMANNKGKAGVDQELIRELAKLLDETGLERDRDRSRRLAGARCARVDDAGHARSVALRRRRTGGCAACRPGKATRRRPRQRIRAACARPWSAPPISRRSPARANFVEVGSRVAQGQTILIIEAMKTMNHIPAPKAGTVTAYPGRQPPARGIRRAAGDHRIAFCGAVSHRCSTRC